MTKTQFLDQYGSRLVRLDEADDYMFYCPEEMYVAHSFFIRGYKIASVFEKQDGEEVVLDNDSGYSPHKTGYYIISPNQ